MLPAPDLLAIFSPFAGPAEHSRAGKCTSRLGGFPQSSHCGSYSGCYREHSPWLQGKRSVSRSEAFGYIQCLYLKKPDRGLLEGWRPKMALGLPHFPTQGNLPASWSLGLTGQELPPPLLCRDGWTAAPFGFEDEAPSVPQHPLPCGFTSGWERKKPFLQVG